MSEANGAALSAQWLFWLSAFFVVYTYFLYPICIAAAARLRPRPPRRGVAEKPAVSVVIAAYNEAKNLQQRIPNLLQQDYPAEKVEIIVISDGSTDDTPAILQQMAWPRVTVIALEQNGGKAVALNAGLAAATGEIIVFADARQTFAPDALRRLVENFADPDIGSVSGELLLTEGDDGVAAQVGLYWRYEKLIRRAEAGFSSMLGATGAIYAIRRALWQPLPPGTLLDDFLTPMRIVLKGKRAIFDGRALAYDRASKQAKQEFRRKIRTLAGNFQAFSLEPALLFPWSNPSTWFQLWSHKLFRLIAPYALIILLLASLVAPGWFYSLAAAGQLLFYAAALLGWLLERTGRVIVWRVVSLAYTFVVLNAAAVRGLIYWLSGGSQARGIWQKAYQEKV